MRHCCSWNKTAKVELDPPLNKFKPLRHVPCACTGCKCKIGPLEFGGEKKAWLVLTPLTLLATSLLPCGALFHDLLEIIQKLTSHREVLMPLEPPAPIHDHDGKLLLPGTSLWLHSPTFRPYLFKVAT